MRAKIEGAIADSRDDLARAGIARQMDLEAQFEVLSRAIDENNEKIEQCVTSLRAVLSALQDAEQRRADLEKSEAHGKPSGFDVAPEAGRRLGSSARRCARAGRWRAPPACRPRIPYSSDIDELSTLHRDKEIAARLARLKSRS